MDEIKIGARILDVLTVGMYPDALDTLREYIQNSCDAIRKAERDGVLDANHGRVFVRIEPEKRKLTIRDNGVGIASFEARSTLLSVGASKKKIGVDAGFRGIGRLAGLAYCEKLIFTTAFVCESVRSETVFDAAEIRRKSSVTEEANRDLTAVEVIEKSTKFSTVEIAPGKSFFEVQMVGIATSQSEFLDIDAVRSYLRQVAPVEFDVQSFVYGHSKINPFFKEKGIHRTINLELHTGDGRQEVIKKPYKTFYTVGAKDTAKEKRVDIEDIDFFTDGSERPRWVAWVAKANDIKGVVSNAEMRGVRLRCQNILVGDHNTFERIFEKAATTNARFNSWYCGEVHVLDDAIIPNSRRDFFEDSEAWRSAEASLVELIAKALARRARLSSQERSRDVDLIQEDAERTISDVKGKLGRGFASDANRAETLSEVKRQEQKIERAQSGKRTQEEIELLERTKSQLSSVAEEIEAARRSSIDESTLSREERKVVRMVMDVVSQVCGAKMADDVAAEVNRRLRTPNRKPKGQANAISSELVAS